MKTITLSNSLKNIPVVNIADIESRFNYCTSYEDQNTNQTYSILCAANPDNSDLDFIAIETNREPEDRKALYSVAKDLALFISERLEGSQAQIEIIIYDFIKYEL